jgi:hypothetical protein
MSSGWPLQDQIFQTSKVRAVIKDVLQSKLAELEYDPLKAAQVSCLLNRHEERQKVAILDQPIYRSVILSHLRTAKELAARGSRTG